VLVALALLAFGPPPIAGQDRKVHYVSPSGSDPNPCTRSSPCASFDRAYLVARPGEVVKVAAGRYGVQSIPDDASKTSPDDVVIRPASGASVTVAGITLGACCSSDGADHLTLQDFKSTGPLQGTNMQDVTLEDIDVAHVVIASSQDVLVRGGDIGPCIRGQGECPLGAWTMLAVRGAGNSNITIDGVALHDYRITRPEHHGSCLFVLGGRNITVRNSNFSNCEFFDIQLNEEHDALTDVLIENNWFEVPWNGRGQQVRVNAIHFGFTTPPENVLIRFNSFHQRTGITADYGLIGARIVGNMIGTDDRCISGAVYSYNFVARHLCGRTNRSALWGYQYAGTRLVAVAPVARIVRQIFVEAAEGRAPNRIARGLQRARISPPVGRRWTSSSVRKIVRNPDYLGHRFGAPGAHRPLVSKRLWDKAQVILR